MNVWCKVTAVTEKLRSSYWTLKILYTVNLIQFHQDGGFTSLQVALTDI